MLYFYKYLILMGCFLVLNVKLKLLVLLTDVNKQCVYDVYSCLFVYPLSTLKGVLKAKRV